MTAAQTTPHETTVRIPSRPWPQTAQPVSRRPPALPMPMPMPMPRVPRMRRRPALRSASAARHRARLLWTLAGDPDDADARPESTADAEASAEHPDSASSGSAPTEPRPFTRRLAALWAASVVAASVITGIVVATVIDYDPTVVATLHEAPGLGDPDWLEGLPISEGSVPPVQFEAYFGLTVLTFTWGERRQHWLDESAGQHRGAQMHRAGRGVGCERFCGERRRLLGGRPGGDRRVHRLARFAGGTAVRARNRHGHPVRPGRRSSRRPRRLPRLRRPPAPTASAYALRECR